MRVCVCVYKHAATSIYGHVTPSQHDENVRFQWLHRYISTFTYRCDDVVPWSENHTDHYLVHNQLLFSPSVPLIASGGLQTSRSCLDSVENYCLAVLMLGRGSYSVEV